MCPCWRLRCSAPAELPEVFRRASQRLSRPDLCRCRPAALAALRAPQTGFPRWGAAGWTLDASRFCPGHRPAGRSLGPGPARPAAARAHPGARLRPGPRRAARAARAVRRAGALLSAGPGPPAAGQPARPAGRVRPRPAADHLGRYLAAARACWTWPKSTGCPCRSTATRMPGSPGARSAGISPTGRSSTAASRCTCLAAGTSTASNAMLWSDYELDGRAGDGARDRAAAADRRARLAGDGHFLHPDADRAAPGHPGPLAEAAGRRGPNRPSTCSPPTRAGWSTSRSWACTATWPRSTLSRMYPAIMVYCNISPETLSEPRRRRRSACPALNLVDRPQPRGAGAPWRCARCWRSAWRSNSAWRSCPPGMRAAGADKQRASALKWLLVTCFGYLGYKNARFGRIEAHQAVTAYGREALLRAKEVAEDLGLRRAADVRGRAVGAAGGQGRPDDSEPCWKRSAGAAGCRLPWTASTAGWSSCPRGSTRAARWPTATLASSRTARSRCAGSLRAAATPRPGSPGCRGSCWNPGPRRRARRCPAAGPSACPAAWPSCARGRVPPEELLVAQRLTREVEDYRSPSPARAPPSSSKMWARWSSPGSACAFSSPWATGRVCLGSALPPDPATLDLARYHELLLRAAAEVLEPFGVTEKRLC